MIEMYRLGPILYWSALFRHSKPAYKLRFEGKMETVSHTIAISSFRSAKLCNYPIICLN